MLAKAHGPQIKGKASHLPSDEGHWRYVYSTSFDSHKISRQFREMSIVTSAGIVILIGEKAFVERFASNCFLSGQN